MICFPLQKIFPACYLILCFQKTEHKFMFQMTPKLLRMTKKKEDTFYCSSHFVKWENVIKSVGLLENYAMLCDNRHEHSCIASFGFILMSSCYWTFAIILKTENFQLMQKRIFWPQNCNVYHFTKLVRM